MEDGSGVDRARGGRLRLDAGITLLLVGVVVAIVVGGAEALGSPEAAPLDPVGPAALVAGLGDPIERDWNEIAPTDTLTALLVNNSTSYFVYRGEAMGFEFRALRRFASDHGMALRVVAVDSRRELFHRLNAGVGDVAAARLVRSPAWESHVRTVGPLYRTVPAVVQRAGAPDSTIFPDFLEDEVDLLPVDAAGRMWPMADSPRVPVIVQRPAGLAGEAVHLPYGSEFVESVEEIEVPEDDPIRIIEVGNEMDSEALVREVARGRIRFSVAPQNVAELKENYFRNIVAKPVIGSEEEVVWATRTTSPELAERLQSWIDENGGEGGYLADLYADYFVDRMRYRERVASEYLTSESGRLSRWDSLIFAGASRIGWDWRLLASQAFQESRFDEGAVSWAGAQGLLQLMPATAKEVGVRDPFDPAENVQGAVRYLEWLDRRWSKWVEDPEARLRFVLASYNAGSGHVEDARRIARAHGDDPDSWEDIAYWLIQLSQREHYRHPVVRFGYVRGLEPVTYVSLILERYSHYRDFVAERPLQVSPAAAEDRLGT